MFKAIKEFFFGKPAQAPEAEAPYKVEAPAAFVPPPKAEEVKAAPAPVNPQITDAVTQVPAKKSAPKKPAAKKAPAKKPAAPAAKKPAAKRSPVTKKPVQ